MTGFILAKKGKSTSGFNEKKEREVYSLLEASACYITQVRTVAKDGYQALQLGMATKTAKNIGKAVKGIATKAGIESPLSYFEEIRVNPEWNAEEVTENNKLGLKIGDKTFMVGMHLKPEEVFALNEKVQVTGTTKGKGFEGVVKLHGFHGGPKTHGQSDRQRAPGAISSGTTPGRIWKGKRMAGRMGNNTKTIKGLSIHKIENNQIWVKGLLPGRIGGVIKLVSIA